MTIKVTYNVTDVYMSQSVSPVYINVSYSDGGSSGGGVWGTITGTLSNQTDLQSALDAKVPYSGATGDVSLGEYGINVGNVIYDTTPTGIPTDQGATYWDADAETVALIMNGTIQKIGEDTFYHVRNTTGSTIAKGTAVRFSGTTGNSGRLLIAPMLANGTYPSQYYMGITSEEIANNQDGKVYHFGKMRNINTSAFADGDVLYVSPSVAGALTATAPVAPNNIIVAAAVVHAANNGTLMIRTTLGSNINTDEGVLLTTPTANQGLFYDSGLWVNKSITTALGYTPANAATTLTINGVTYDLSTSRTWTVAAGISGSGAAGQITYWTGASAVSGSSTFLWDNTNSRLAIGASTTWQAGIGTLSVVNGTSDAPILSLKNTDASKQVYYASYNDTNKSLQYIVYGSTAAGTLFGQFRANAAVILGYNTPSYLAIGNFENVPLIFGNNNQERFRVTTSGNVSIGTTSDLAVRLGVVGDTLLRGSGATSATTALTVQNSSSTNLLTVRNDGNTIVGTGTPTSFYLRGMAVSGTTGDIGFGVFNSSTTGTSGFTLGQSNTAFASFFKWGSAYAGNFVGSSIPFANAAQFQSGSNNDLTLIFQGTPIVFNCGITATNIAARISTGAYRITTLANAHTDGTALLDLDASTTTRASLRIRSGTAPTTPNDGDIWFDGTDIKMRIGGVTKTFTLV